MARLYATDSNNLVWVLRQTGAGGENNYPWSWTTWHPLGNNCAQFANGPLSLQTSEMFSMGVDNTLSVLDQNPVTLAWTANQVQRPAGTGEDVDHVSLYKTEITALDDNGSPVSGAQVTIAVEEPAVLFVASQQWILDSGGSATGLTSFVQAIETSIKQPSDFRQMAMTDLLNSLENVILAALTFADGICEAFLQLINAVLAAINNLLNAQIQIPLIPKIFTEFGLGEVTALNLCSLMIALPISVCYELLTNGSPLFTDAQVEQITSGNSATALPGAVGDDSGVTTAISFCNAGVTLLWLSMIPSSISSRPRR